MKSISEKKQKKFKESYNNIMKGFQEKSQNFTQTPQWASPGDFITKFSLYQELPHSITSSDTAVNLGN
jgi:hypothetical protein